MEAAVWRLVPVYNQLPCNRTKSNLQCTHGAGIVASNMCAFYSCTANTVASHTHVLELCVPSKSQMV